MSNTVDNQVILTAIENNAKNFTTRFDALEKKIDKAQEQGNDHNTRIALLEKESKDQEKDIDNNWAVTRKLDGKITKWGGVLTAMGAIGATLLALLK